MVNLWIHILPEFSQTEISIRVIHTTAFIQNKWTSTINSSVKKMQEVCSNNFIQTHMQDGTGLDQDTLRTGINHRTYVELITHTVSGRPPIASCCCVFNVNQIGSIENGLQYHRLHHCMYTTLKFSSWGGYIDRALRQDVSGHFRRNHFFHIKLLKFYFIPTT